MAWIFRAVAAVWICAGALAPPAFGAQGDDPDWPCIQRKVPELSLGQVWTGPALPQTTVGWSTDETVSAWVADLSARRLPLPEAEQKIRDAAGSLPDEERQRQMTMLVQGLFDHMNQERSQVIAGIARYAHRQRDLAAALRQESAAVDALRGKTDANPMEIAARADRLTFQTRIFQERVQSLTFVCEVPTLIEQRLYALVKTIAEMLAPKK